MPELGRTAADRLARVWKSPLWVHAALYGVLLAVTAPLLQLDSAFIVDEGAYALQVHALRHGSWMMPLTLPSGAANWSATLNGTATSRGSFPYLGHPLYPLLLTWSTRLLGVVAGLHLLPLLGAVLCAVAAWLLAGEIAPDQRRVAFWIAAASPVLAHGTVIWAHTLSAGVAGLAIVLAVRAVRLGPRLGILAALCGCAALGVLLRSEALLFALALGTVVGLVAWARLGLVKAAVCAGSVVVPAGLSVVLETRWRAAIQHGTAVVPGLRQTTPMSLVFGRLSGAWHELVDPGLWNHRVVAVGSVALALSAVACVRARRGGPGAGREVAVLSVAAAFVFVARTAIAPGEPATGILVAWPATLWLIAGFRWRGRDWQFRLTAAVTGLFLVLVLATQYGTGGGIEWGWRFASPVFAPLAVLAAIGIARVLQPLGPVDRRWVAVSAAGSIALAGITGLVAVRAQRVHAAAVVREVARADVSTVVTTEPALPPVAWRTAGSISWLSVSPDQVPAALAALRAAGVPKVAVVGSVQARPGEGGYAVAASPPAPTTHRAGYHFVVLDQG